MVVVTVDLGLPGAATSIGSGSGVPDGGRSMEAGAKLSTRLKTRYWSSNR